MFLRRFLHRTKMAPLTIVTHSGTFHADESLAVHMLRLLPEYKDAKIVRTRDFEVISKGDVVVDVGGVYDPATHRYDHHQREFVDTFDDKHRIRLSSAGLVYKHFGRRVLREALGDATDETIETLYINLYDALIKEYDGVDNGVPQYPSDIKPAYKTSTSISDRVSALNPWWNMPTNDLDERFMRAVALCGAEFDQKVQYLAKAWLPARQIVVKALESRKTVDSSGKILLLEQFCPWKEHLHLLESNLNIATDEQPFYVVYQDSSTQWRIQAVPIRPSSFVSRKTLPEPWHGIRDQKLSDLTDIPGCVFVHATGFIGGNLTREGALKMAKAALAA